MSADDPANGGNGGSGNSFAAQHPAMPRHALNVAPTDGSTKFNTIRIPLIPVACWRLNDPAFAFDSSFVSPTFRAELGTLAGIVGANQGCPAALFGHCDPAGSDTLNKTLGDCRAIAVYAVLTRQPALWAYLHDTPQVGDTWDLHMVQMMLGSVPDGTGAPYYSGVASGVSDDPTVDAVKRFQSDAGLTSDGDPGANTRKALYGAYMDWLCTKDGTPFRMQLTDFLGGAGAQPGDLPKMSLQSCGKFNPIVLLTTDEMGGEDTTDGASKTTRNADDAPNRRVIMFLFEKGTTVDTGLWPCPKVKDTNDACKSQFWPDGDTRRKNGDTKRLYEITRDTMACRFYDRFARRSPCESGSPPFVLRVLDDEKQPMAAASVHVEGDGFTPTDLVADAGGWVSLGTATLPAVLHVSWTPSGAASPIYRRDVFPYPAYDDQGDDQRLQNLGFYADTPDARVRDFQAFVGAAPTGLIADVSDKARDWHDGGATPVGGEATDTTKLPTGPLTYDGTTETPDLKDLAQSS